jgi:hypothetical protein
MTVSKHVRVSILRVTQSPMNALRWVLDLSGGHEAWITQKMRPRLGKSVHCAVCGSQKR